MKDRYLKNYFSYGIKIKGDDVIFLSILDYFINY